MTIESLLLAPDTRVTCPACEQEFSLEQGFAKQALGSVEAASASALAVLKEQERAAAQRRAEQLAAEQAKSARRQLEDMQRLLKEQGEAHSKALAEMRDLSEQAFKPQLDAMKVQLTDSHAQMKVMRDEQLALRTERQKLKDEKDALALDVQKQVDGKLAERESAARTQEQEKAQLDESGAAKEAGTMCARNSQRRSAGWRRARSNCRAKCSNWPSKTAGCDVRFRSVMPSKRSRKVRVAAISCSG